MIQDGFHVIKQRKQNIKHVTKRIIIFPGIIHEFFPELTSFIMIS